MKQSHLIIWCHFSVMATQIRGTSTVCSKDCIDNNKMTIKIPPHNTEGQKSNDLEYTFTTTKTIYLPTASDRLLVFHKCVAMAMMLSHSWGAVTVICRDMLLVYVIMMVTVRHILNHQHKKCLNNHRHHDFQMANMHIVLKHMGFVLLTWFMCY